MGVAEIIAAIRAVTALGSTLASALDAAHRGEVLTPEQQQAVTDARKLAVQNANQVIDEKLGE